MVMVRVPLAILAAAVVAGCSRLPPLPLVTPLSLTPAPVSSAPAVSPHTSPVSPTLQRIAITDPPVVTGLPGPSKCHAVGKLPDPVCTPGSVNPAVTQATIGSTICTSGWTATVRPSSANTAPVKTRSMIAYGVVPSARSITELDHLVPLELAGSNDTSNTWAELSDIPGHGFNNVKDGTETRLKVAVCSGRATLVAAQNAIAANWTTAEHVLGLK